MAQFHLSAFRLTEGIVAQKFHYSDQKQDKCTIYLSPNLKHFSWSYHMRQSVVGLVNIDKQGRCEISSIKGIVYGAHTSTFHKFRKQILRDIDNPEIKPPFYAWQCLSIFVEDRTLDFVVQNEEHLMDFVYCLNLLMDYSRLQKLFRTTSPPKID